MAEQPGFNKAVEADGPPMPPAYSEVGAGPSGYPAEGAPAYYGPPQGYPAYPPQGPYTQQPGGPPPPPGVVYPGQQPGGPPPPPGVVYPGQQPGGPPPPPGVVYPGQPNVVVVQAQPVIMGPVFSECPVRVSCPQCHSEVTTVLDYETGALAWIICAILFGLGFVVLVTWCFCCVPFCIPSCKDVVHRCPNCRIVLGRKNRM